MTAPLSLGGRGDAQALWWKLFWWLGGAAPRPKETNSEP